MKLVQGKPHQQLCLRAMMSNEKDPTRIQKKTDIQSSFENGDLYILYS